MTFGMPTEINIERTQSGTFLSNGIEYNDFPTPGLLVKAMSRKHAESLLDSGILRIRHLEYFRNWENKVLGDANDGKGQYLLKGNPMDTDSINDVYAWCLSYPEIADSRLTLFTEQGGYNCKLVIHDPEELFQRIRKWLANNRSKLWVNCGAVKYDRSQEIDKETLNSQPIFFNVFQKAASFIEDHEYRLSIINCTFRCLHNECSPTEGKYIDLEIGSCRDIASIEDLPNNINKPSLRTK